MAIMDFSVPTASLGIPFASPLPYTEHHHNTTSHHEGDNSLQRENRQSVLAPHAASVVRVFQEKDRVFQEKEDKLSADNRTIRVW
jgi:hypothetical protein